MKMIDATDGVCEYVRKLDANDEVLVLCELVMHPLVENYA